MEKNLLDRAVKLLVKQKRRKRWHKLVSALACIVVFCTTYALILPAITMEQKTICGREEHTHTEECYVTPKGTLDCTEQVHSHSDSCYDADGNLICGWADYVVHTHDENCYDEYGALVCTLPEIKAHEHDSGCYEERRVLICTQEETEGHTHTDDCYRTERVLDCTEPEHTHTDSCYDADGNLSCTLQEHTHGELCYHNEKTLVCTQEETQGHTHTDACYRTEKVLKCGESELHTHTDSCYENGALVCGKLELKEHQHTGDCWRAPADAAPVLVCELEEHTHSEECYADVEDGSADTAEEPTVTEESAADADEQPAADGSGVMTLDLEDDGAAATAGDLGQYLTSVSGSGTTYDKDTGYYNTLLTLSFTLGRQETIDDGYTYTYTLPSGVLVQESLVGNEYDMMDGSTTAGHYTFTKNADGTYTVTVTMLEDYVSKAGETMAGSISFNGLLDGSTQTEDGDIQVKFEDDIELVIPKEEIEYDDDETVHYDIEVSKSGTCIISEDGTEQLVYTVYVWSAKGTPEPISLTDVLTANGITISELDSVKVESCTRKVYEWYSEDPAVGETISAGQYSYSYADNTLTMSLPKLAAGEKTADYTQENGYRITYTYNLADIETGTTSLVNNRATVVAKDEKTEETVTDTAEKTVTINKEYQISKAYQMLSGGDLIWMITANANHQDIAGQTVTDTMFDGKTVKASELTISPSNGYTIQSNAEGYVTGITFTGVNGDANTQSYSISYTQDVQTTWESVHYANTAEMGGASSGEIGVNVQGGDLKKEVTESAVAEDGESASVTWRVNITLPDAGLPAGTVIQDTFPDGVTLSAAEINEAFSYLGGYPSTDSDTRCGGIGFTDGSSGGYDAQFLGSDGKWHSFTEVRGGGVPDLTFSQFKVTLNEAVVKTENNPMSVLRLEYTTTVDLTGAQYGSNRYTNSVKVDNREAQATYTYQKPGVVKTDGDGNSEASAVSNADGTLTWKVTTYLDEKYKSITVTDSLPEGVELQSVSVMVGNENLGSSTPADGLTLTGPYYYNASGTYTMRDSGGSCALTICGKNDTVNLPVGTAITVTYTCKLSDEALTAAEAGKTYSYTNSAAVTSGETDIGSDSQTQEWTKTTGEKEDKTVDKSGSWDRDSQCIDYSVVINPEGKDLLAGSDTLKLRDVFQYQKAFYEFRYDLQQGSVKLYQAVVNEDGTCSKGDEVKNWSWTYSTSPENPGQWDTISNTIDAAIPDSTPLILEYSYQISFTKPDGFDDPKLSDGTVKNAVTVYGDSEHSGSDKRDDQWEKSQTSGEITTDKRYTFYKVDESNYGQTLSGAVFSVYQYVGTGTEGADEDGYIPLDKTYETVNGTFAIAYKDGGYETNTLYKVVETTAPEGYLLPDTARPYYFYFSSTEDTAHTLPNLPDGAVNLSEESATVYAENAKNAASIQVDKQWFTKDGSDVTGQHGGEITFDLYQKAGTARPDSGGGGDSGGSSETVNVAVNIGQYNVDGTVLKESLQCEPGATITLTLTSDYDFTPTIRTYGADGSVWSKYTDLSPSSQDGNTRIYTYTVGSADVTIGGYVSSNAVTGSVSVQQPSSGGGSSGGDSGETSETETKYGAYTISSSDGWTRVISDLPLQGTDEDGNTVYYTYYVREVNVTNYTTAYQNNGGISGGTIIIQNTAVENPSFSLPDTGGAGTIWYTLGGLLLMAVTAPLLYKHSGRRREGRPPS